MADILPCLGKPQTIVVQNSDPELRAILARERDRMDEKIHFLTHNRDAITRYIEALQRAAASSPAEEPGMSRNSEANA